MGTQPLPKEEAGPGGGAPQFSDHVYCGQTAGWIKMTLGMEVGLGPVHIVLDGDTAPLPQKGGRAPQFSAHLYCGQTAGYIKMPLGMEVGLSPGDFVLDGDPAHPLPKRGRSPQFSVHVCCGQTAGWTKMPLGMASAQATLCSMGTQPPPQKGGGAPPQFRPMSNCGQTAAWIKMPLGTEVGFGPDDIVLDGDPAPPFPKNGQSPLPIFGPCLLWPNCWMD